MNTLLSLQWLTTSRSSLTKKRQSQKSTLPFLVTFCLLLALLPLTTAAQVVVTSIQRQAPSNAITNADELTFRVTFDKPVSRVDAGDFSLSGDGLGGASINEVMAVSASVYDVSISGITNNNGTVNLDIKGVGGVSGTNDIAYTDETLNVSNLDHEDIGSFAAPILGFPFTPTTSGLVTVVTVFKSNLSTYVGPATIEILTGEGLNGDILASQTVAVTSGREELSVTFSTPASVTSGTKYTLKISGDIIENKLSFRLNRRIYPEFLYSSLGSSSIIDLLFKIYIGSYSVPLSTTRPTTNETYMLDNEAPVVTGVADNGLYNNDRTITFNEGSATLNGAAFTSGSTVSANGNYILIVTDAASNSTTVQFTLDKITLNTVDKLSEKEDITVTFSSSEFTNAFSSIVGSLTKIKITSLPSTTGVLKLGTNNVTLNQEILAEDLSTLTFVPAANYNGNVSFTWNGSNGAAYAASDAVVKITLAAVNDAPSFIKGADQTVNEDAGAQSVAEWATAISEGPANESSQTIDFIVTNNNNGLFSAQPAIADDGTLTYTPAANAYGLATVSVKITDNGGTANGGDDESAIQTFTITLTPVNDAPEVTATPATQQVQYSDPIATVRIAATDVDNSLNQLSATSSWKLASASTFTTGLPNALSFTQTSAGNWTLSGRMMLAPGTYIVRVTVNDGTADASNNSAYSDIEIVVLPEDARVTYTGALFASTSGATSGKATVTLSATIQDITAVLADPAYDIFAGDIKKASLTFKIVETGEMLLAPIGYVSSSDNKTGTATTTWNVDIGNVDAKQYTVQLLIGDHYLGSLTPVYEVVTVSKPLNDFVTGGGYIIMSNSAGEKAGNAGSKNNFGFNIKYNKKGTSLQGNINTLIRRTESDGLVHVYQIKGNAMTSLSVKASTATTGQAVFNGKASIQDITNPLAPVSVDGNATLQVTMTDMGEPGSSDKIGITVWNKEGGLWFSSTWDGSKTIEKTLAGGNLLIRGASKARMDFDDNIQTEASAELAVYPNPVVDKVIIDLKGMAAIGAKTIVTDAVGKAVLENAHKVVGESLLEIDMNGLRSGLYLIGLRTKASYQVVKVIKQ